MSLFALADLHLSLGTNKPMDVFPGWTDYVQRLETNWNNLISPDDTVVIAGDISWAMSLDQTKKDFTFLNSLPGRKLIIKGNHDYWWTTRKKMDDFLFDNGFNTLRILHNSAETEGTIAVCGTRGWFYDAEEDIDKKILMREVGRLNRSIDAAAATGKQPIVFLHYPPVYGNTVCQEIVDVLRQRDIQRCYYGHIHGNDARRMPVRTIHGIRFQLISCDAVDFTPVLIE